MKPEKSGEENMSRRVFNQPSHNPLPNLIRYCVRGNESSHFKECGDLDHIAELCMLLHDDIDDHLWCQDTTRYPGTAIRELVDVLANKVAMEDDLEAAKAIFAVATHAAFEVMEIYLRKRHLFDRIAPNRKILPMLASIHPNTQTIMSRMLADSQLGSHSDDSARVLSKPWFVSDTPANVYARAIIVSIQMNQRLDPLKQQRKLWKSYDLEHGTRTCVLPYPDFVKGLNFIPSFISPDCVNAYWKKGKEIILEEMPNFINYPEWESYHHRHYPGGAKPGVIRSAIFRDILTALRVMASVAKSDDT